MKTILVIDDEKGMRKALDRQLRRAGYRVLLAESGQQALDLLREEAVDLILLDHQLPDMNGLDVFEQMQERRLIDGVSVGMMTAYGSIPLATAFMSKGGDFFVEKPFYPPGILEVTIARELNIAKATRKQVEARTAELNRLKEQAESANRLKSRILENIEHQVRTPLSVAMGYAELLSGAQMPEKTRQMAASLYDALQSLHRLLEGIWRVSRLQSGEPIKTETVALETCIDALHYRRRAEEKRLALDVNVSGITVQADREALTEVFDCLLDNAIKFTDQGKVIVRAQESEDVVVTVVQDTGIGIDSQHAQAIFDLFFKVDDSGFRSGAGVGLFIVKTLVKAMGGQIWVESELGRGSAFFVALPLGADAGEKRRRGAEAQRAGERGSEF